MSTVDKTKLKEAILKRLVEKGDYASVLSHISGEEKEEKGNQLTNLIKPMSAVADILTENAKGAFMEDLEKRLDEATTKGNEELRKDLEKAHKEFQAELKTAIDTDRKSLSKDILDRVGDAQTKLQTALATYADSIVTQKAEAMFADLGEQAKLTDAEIADIIFSASLEVESQIVSIVGEYIADQGITVSQITDFKTEVQKLIPQVDFSSARINWNQIIGAPSQGGTNTNIVRQLIAEALANNPGGSSTFLDLTDTPATYTGQGGKTVTVKVDETGLEFTTPAGGGGSETLADVSASSTDTAKSLYTMSTDVDVEFEDDGGNTILYLDESTASVGIGTTTPLAKLSVTDTILAGSGSLAGSVFSLDQTWNTTGTPSAFTIDITDTASNANSNLMSLTVNGSNWFYIRKNGFIYSMLGSMLFNNKMQITQSGITGSSAAFFGWASGVVSGSTSSDTRLYRDGAGILAQRTTTSAQEFRIYNTDSTDDEFVSLGFQQNANVFTIETEATGAATVRPIALMGGNVGIGTITPTAGKLTVDAGTATTDVNALNITQTWNNAGVTFTGIKSNITNTASAAASLLLDLQVASASVFNIQRDGSLVNNNLKGISAPTTRILSVNAGTWVSDLSTSITSSVGSVSIGRLNQTISASADGSGNTTWAALVTSTGDKTFTVRGFDTDAVNNRGVQALALRGGAANANGESITGQGIVGGAVSVTGGAGASSASGVANGGSVSLDGGQGYGTGLAGNIILGGTRGLVGVGTTSPTARLHLAAGTATANTAPLKLTAGTNLTTPEAGVFEFSNSETGLTFTAVATRRQVVLDTATQTLTNKTLTSPNINEAVALTATATELNVLDGITATTTELNYTDGVTSAIQTQLNAKVGYTTTTTASSATPTPTGDAQRNELIVTALTDNATIAAPTGTPAAGNMLKVIITASGGTRTVGYNAALTAGNVTRTTSVPSGETLVQVYQYQNAAWVCAYDDLN
jgi:hypothetical protein